MKVKFGDLTVRQLEKVCEEHKSCRNCPLYIKTYTDNMRKRCATHVPSPVYYITEVEIDLPDEEVKDDD